jgi:hypothetical protein
MGQLSHFNLAAAIKTYDLRHLVETGTGCGAGLAFACSLPFTSLWSCEIEPTVMQYVMDTLTDERVTLFVGPSERMLDCLGRFPRDERILFWLDAHFPGAQWGLRRYVDERDEAIRLPVQSELAMIKKHRPLNEDVIIIDDARIWLDEEFEEGPFPPNIIDSRPAELGIDFIHALFGETHRIDVLHNAEGYIVLSPKAISDEIAVTVTSPG